MNVPDASPPDERSTDCLLALLKSGDDRAIRPLFGRYYKQFYRFARRNELSHEDADEAAQETFFRIANRIQRYNPVLGKGESWMWVICRNIVLDTLRRLRRKPHLSFDAWQQANHEAAVPSTADLTGSDPADAVPVQLALKEAFDSLSPMDQTEIRRGKGRGGFPRASWSDAVSRFRQEMRRRLS